MTRDGEFLAAALNAEVLEITDEHASDNFWLALRIERDTLIAGRIWQKTLAFNEAGKLGKEPFPDFGLEVARELNKSERLYLRKKYCGA
jgi:hypothetical protein